MRAALTGRQIDITPGLRQLVTRRLTRLERLLNHHIVSAHVVLHQEKFRLHSEVTLHMRGEHVLQGRAAADTWAASLTTAVSKVEQQASTVKGKWEARKRRAASVGRQFAARAEEAAAAEESAAAGPRIVRMRRYPVKPMSVEDAALKVGDAPNAFIVFRDADTEGVAVLYRRPDGHLGLIEPGV
jgi:putative sigma-54 modulation protein